MKKNVVNSPGKLPEKQMFRPALTPEARENQLISLAMDLAEKQLRDGTASSQVITAFLKLGSTRERLEQERLKMEQELAEAKKEALKSDKEREKLYSEALDAMRLYSGSNVIEDGEEPNEY